VTAWSNISTSAGDREITTIDEFEAGLGNIPEKVRRIRELITRLEVCHFKYRRHIRIIKASILALEPMVIPESIGRNHIQHGEAIWQHDSTGRSLLGQQYVWAIKTWMGQITPASLPVHCDGKLVRDIQEVLGTSNKDKYRLVRLLAARLTWDWKSYEDLQQGGAWEELEHQICRLDICHYAFPTNLDRVLKAIGEMRSVRDFEGCGSFTLDIREHVIQELLTFNEMFKTLRTKNRSGARNRMKVWLLACLIKTLKEQVEVSDPLIGFDQ
jgi:hypothetical protein